MAAEATDYPLVIQQLEAEIEELRRKLSQQNKDNKLLEAWRDHIHGTRSDASQGSTDVTKALVESMQYQKDLLVQVTGVDIEGSNTEILKQGEKTKMVRDAQSGRWSRELISTTDISDDLSLVKRQIVDGNCGDIDFQLMLDVEESMDSDGIIHSNISQLSISASENIYIDMRDTIERLANERNAQGFLRMLDSYKTWRSAREKCFQHFVTTYPKVATSPSDDILHLKHPTKNFKFVIEWNLFVTDRYTVYPHLQLDIEIPKKVQEETDILTSAPEKFQLMLKELGIERTLKTLVMLLLR